MTDPTIESRVQRVIAEALRVVPEAVVPSARLGLDLAADSLDTISVTIELEDEFDLEISDEEAQRLVTVADVVAYVRGRLGEAGHNGKCGT